ncbi:MAG: hypothetical protein WAN14_04045 [Candidatus Acidiferrales bacterium]
MSESDDILRGMDVCSAPHALAPPNTAGEVAEPRWPLLQAGIAQARRLGQLLQRAISFPAMLGMLLVGAVFVVGSTFSVDPDMWWHIRVGQEILSTHHWPTTDPYSFTVAGQPWMAYEWLGEVLLGGIARIAGLQGLMALLIVLASAVILALYGYTTLRSGNSKASFVACAVLYALATPFFSMRPQMLGYFFLILTLIALELFRQGKSRFLWFLPVIFLLWVNTHGSFIVGLGTIFVYWLAGLKQFELGGIEGRQWTAAQRTRLELIFLLCLAVLPITPYGTRLAMYPFDMALSQPVNVANILEWQPMPFNLLDGKIFLVLLLGFFVTQVAFQLTFRVEELALFLFGTMMACLHLRFLILFVPFFAPLLATTFARWVPRYDRKKDIFLLNAALMALVIGCIVHYFRSNAEMQQLVAKTFPAEAVQYIHQHHVPGPLFNNYGFGGYLVWALPGQKVFIDGRGDVFERGGVFSDYLQIANLRPGALAVLDHYNVQSCLLKRDEAMATVLSASPEWKRIYWDSVSALYVRQPSDGPLRKN